MVAFFLSLLPQSWGRVVLGRSEVRRVLDGVSGVVLVGFGAGLALQQR